MLCGVSTPELSALGHHFYIAYCPWDSVRVSVCILDYELIAAESRGFPALTSLGSYIHSSRLQAVYVNERSASWDLLTPRLLGIHPDY